MSDLIANLAGVAAVGDKPVLVVESAAEWEAWLAANPDSDGVRLRLRKKSAGPAATGITYPEALDSALCFGWIDGQAGVLDDDYSLRVFTPRRSRSMWSQRNREHVARLREAGRMRPSGLAAVEQARADGRWDAAYRQKDAPVPADLQQALDDNPIAREFFTALSAQNRFAILFRIGNVKREATRAAKIQMFVAMLEQGQTPHPQPHRNQQGRNQ
jgi:uncharacterized protein YdeI (YjbR/CyaY-like superfamily)